MHGATTTRKLMWGTSPAAAGSDRPDDHDVVIVLASLLCALIAVLGVGLVARCACGGRGPRAQQAAAAAAAAAANRGVKKSVLRRIPTVPYVAPAAAACGSSSRSEGDADAEAVECAICLAEFEEGEPTRVLPQCGHAFHAACVDEWLRGHSSCPSCRRLLSHQLPPGERCRRCGARPHDAGAAGPAWKPTYYSAMPPFLA
ncbi:RING-H2 finger protein ATL74 [Zea mays]|jgi:hypothetical protein|uniref:Putative RING zinc finger domain superfamily protein n=1 Tax=Zea mays TaxID=4577 RepID=K7TVH6_MAIZE|nr:RING-H2 finger protein ATL74 [Zea mays]AQK45314.1 Putative RING zinc finger domain superfamily protein [Zea mays]|eukprot:XP_008663453.1 RING-H2 finger protein ATL74 [Zea mays]